MTSAQWDLVADAVNPLLLVVFLGYTSLKQPPPAQRVRFLLLSGLALLIAWLIAHLDHWISAFQNVNGFPSGHMAFYTTLATSLALLNPRSLVVTLPLAALYGGLIVFLHYHSWWDLLAAMLLAVPVTLLCHRLVKPKPQA